MVKYFISLFITLCSYTVIALDFDVHGDLSSFEKKPVVVLWRGTHFSPTHFPDTPAQQKYMGAHGLQVPIYCAAAHKKTEISYTAKLTRKHQVSLNACVRDIQTRFKALEQSGPITIDRKPFDHRRHAFQQIYSNSTNFIAALGADQLPTHYRKYRPILTGLPKGNPLLSFTTDVGHAGSYGYGLKDYGHIDALSDLYDAQGHRQYAYAGYLQGILLNDNTARLTLPYDVVAHHNKGHITVSTHFSNNILTEKEVSFVGKMLGSAVTFTMPVELPDLSGPYPGEYRNKFGLTKRKYDNIRGIVTDPQTSSDKKKDRVTRMLKEIISPLREDNGLVYRHTLRHATDTFIEGVRDGFDDFKAGAIGLNGRVYNPALY